MRRDKSLDLIAGSRPRSPDGRPLMALKLAPSREVPPLCRCAIRDRGFEHTAVWDCQLSAATRAERSFTAAASTCRRRAGIGLTVYPVKRLSRWCRARSGENDVPGPVPSLLRSTDGHQPAISLGAGLGAETAAVLVWSSANCELLLTEGTLYCRCVCRRLRSGSRVERLFSLSADCA